MGIRLVQATITIPMEVADDVSDSDFEFHLNEGTWCWDNLIDILQEHSDKYGCICDICEGKVLRGGKQCK